MMDLNKFEGDPFALHSCASKEKINALLNEYQKEYYSKLANKNKTQEITVELKFKKHQKNKRNIFLVKGLTYLLYFINILNLLPCDSGIHIKIPPWTYEQPKPKLNIEDFLIEPDWKQY